MNMRAAPELQRRRRTLFFGRGPFQLVFGAMLGVAIGLGGFTFKYAEGLSYFSADPRACVNCHIMQPQYDSWQKSSHHAVAACVDCHLPHTFFSKYMAKAENGYHHSKGFTLQDFHEPIMIKSKNLQILQQNCLECHRDIVHGLVPSAIMGVDAIQCVHCYQSVGHGEPAGLGGPDRNDPIGR